MTSVVNTKFAVKPVAAALTLALSAAAGVALAAPTPNQMPGGGIVTDVSLGSTTVVGTKYANLVSPTTITGDGKVVIRWGLLSDQTVPGPVWETVNPLGFNLGSNAKLTFTTLAAGGAFLNIDASGNPSQIFGTLVADKSGGAVPQIFLANANGIVVGAGGRIVAPMGVGLIGADMNNSTSRNDFVANNGWVNPPGPVTLGTSYLTFGALPTAGATPGQIDIGGSINGDLVANEPARYILVAGNNVNVVNGGNLFGERVVLNAGVIATASKATVNGVTNTTVNRLFNVDTSTEVAWRWVGSASDELTIAGPAGSGNITNDGSISARGPSGEIALQAAGNIRSGSDGSNDTLVGLFSDHAIFIDSYSDESTVELYNVIKGYTTNVTLPSLYVNGFASNDGQYSPTAQSFRADVLVKAITPGLQPSSITTTDEVEIYGGNVTIASTINHKLASDGSPQGDFDLVLDASKALTVSGDIGAGHSVYMYAGTDMTISGNVIANTDQGAGYSGGIYGYGGTGLTRVSGNLTVVGTDDIYFEVHNDTEFSGTSTTGGDFVLDNDGQGATNKTTISGDIITGGGVYIWQGQSPLNAPILISGNIMADGDVDISNDGASLGNTTTVTGDVTSYFGDVSISNLGLLTGMLETTGVISADGTATLFSDGDAKIGEVNADNILTTVLGLNLDVNGPWTAGTSASIVSPLATTKFVPDAVVTAPAVTLAGLTYRGVDAAGAPYASQGDKPDAQFVTNVFTVALSGNINAPIAGNTNWPLNSMDIAPLATLAPVLVSVTANGGGFQAVNLRVLGNSIFNTGATTTPYIGVPLTSGGFPAGGLQGNLGSQLIMQADGSLIIMGTPTGSLTGPPVAAQWPGGAAFIAGTTLQLLTPFYNAWTTASPAFGGSFFTAPAISLNGYIATSGTAWANFSTAPLTGDPTVYQIRQLGTNSFGFAATTEFVKNDYMSTVAGGAVCAVTGPTTWLVCP